MRKMKCVVFDLNTALTNVSILVILRTVRHAYIITNNANHSHYQILGMRGFHQKASTWSYIAG